MAAEKLEELLEFLAEIAQNLTGKKENTLSKIENSRDYKDMTKSIMNRKWVHTLPEVNNIAEETNRPCDCEAQIICTKASKDSEPLHIKKEKELIHKNGSVTLNETDIELDGVFKSCIATGRECECVINNQENIIRQKWEGTDGTVTEYEAKKTVTYQESYMICTKGGCLYCLDSSEKLAEYMNIVAEENEGIAIPEIVEGEVNGNPITLFPTVDWGCAGKGNYDEGVQKDGEGRYKIAVGPKILETFYPDTGKIWKDDFENWPQLIDVLLENKQTGAQKMIKCVVVDVKAHTYNKNSNDKGEMVFF